ncbi:MAG: hypothetical protein WBQ10_01160 [Terriglobales bacterium]
MSAPKRLAYPSPPWPYPLGLLIAWPKAEPVSAAAIVAKDTLLFAASLNFCHGLNGPELVARLGKNTDFRCKKDILLCSGFSACGAVCACAVAEGASGGEPDWLSCATLPAHAKQKMAIVNVSRCIPAPRSYPIKRLLDSKKGAIPRLGKTGFGWLFSADYPRLSSDLQEDVFAIQ